MNRGLKERACKFGSLRVDHFFLFHRVDGVGIKLGRSESNFGKFECSTKMSELVIGCWYVL